MQHKNFIFKTRDGFEISVNRWEPDEGVEIKALVQLHHGLAEHSLRYDRFGSILAENGFVFNAYDMRGHGQTAENSIKNGSGIFGKLADKKGFEVGATWTPYKNTLTKLAYFHGKRFVTDADDRTFFARASIFF